MNGWTFDLFLTIYVYIRKKVALPRGIKDFKHILLFIRIKTEHDKHDKFIAKY